MEPEGIEQRLADFARSSAGSSAKLVLIGAMVLGSLALWLVIPVSWLWIGSQLTESTQASMGPYLVVAVGIVVSMVAMGWVLSRLNRAYSRLSDQRGPVRVRLPWLRSMRAERDPVSPLTVLDAVMIVTVAAAAIVMAFWFFVLAGSSLPT
jgi:hypothetical protein